MYETSRGGVDLLERTFTPEKEVTFEKVYTPINPVTGKDIDEIISKSKVSPRSYHQPGAE